MKLCPKCNQIHDLPGTFCSRSCANSRQFSEESKLKKSIALKGRSAIPRQYNREVSIQKLRETRLRKYLSTPFEQLGVENRRRRVFEEQKYCCNSCGIFEWRGIQISLELEHIDGNNQNNKRENLEGLCPNCHSITTTWRGRNKPSRNGDRNITNEYLLECLQQSKNIRQGLLKAGISAKGSNYERAKKLLGRSSPARPTNTLLD